jgi:hypothetical protein
LCSRYDDEGFLKQDLRIQVVLRDPEDSSTDDEIDIALP